MDAHHEAIRDTITPVAARSAPEEPLAHTRPERGKNTQRRDGTAQHRHGVNEDAYSTWKDVSKFTTS